ncbi:MAG: hypothetical protein IPG58_15800 [Acidobacteria bacterium]|nr:hypothetical protein [Acidobacteriota bacterium]
MAKGQTHLRSIATVESRSATLVRRVLKASVRAPEFRQTVVAQLDEMIAFCKD